jgi:hypothetical protein
MVLLAIENRLWGSNKIEENTQLLSLSDGADSRGCLFPAPPNIKELGREWRNLMAENRGLDVDKKLCPGCWFYRTSCGVQQVLLTPQQMENDNPVSPSKAKNSPT